MMVALSLILSLMLLAGIIYVLRRHQHKVLQDVVEREQPLPPLPHDSSGDADNAGPGQAPDLTEPATIEEAAPESSPNMDSAPPPQSEPDPVPELTAARTPDPKQWREHSQTLREAGAYEAALSACEMGWPRWQSYQEAARVIRAAIRASAAEERDIWLERLYQLAAQASFLHDKVQGMPDPNWQMLAQRFDHADVTALEMPWDTLGYQQLRLLTKSDIKLLTKTKNEPKNHQSARVLHRKQW